MPAPYSTPPTSLKQSLSVEPFKIAIPDSDLEELQTSLKAARLPRPIYEGDDRRYGVTSGWMDKAMSRWRDGFDWCEALSPFQERID